jgi:flagellin
MSKSLTKLSTGLRINSSADDAAGLGVSENLRTQINGLSQALKNTQDAISMLNIADGALNEQAGIVQRMRELVVQALNDTYSSTERGYMGTEFVALRDELDRIAAATNYNKMQLFAAPAMTDGTAIYGASDTGGDAPRKTQDAGAIFTNDPLFGAADYTSGHHFNMMVGANYSTQDTAAFDATYNAFGSSATNLITIEFGQMDANGILSLNPFQTQAADLFDNFNMDLTDMEDQLVAVGAWLAGDIADPTLASPRDKLRLLLKVIDGGDTIDETMKIMVFGGDTAGKTYTTGIKRINEMRASIGAMTNRLEHSVNNTINQINNQQAAESSIRDVDFASETTTFTRNQILTQSATAMLAQANQVGGNVLTLLK